MNFKSRIIIGCLLGACTLQVSAEKTYKYRINLRDKAETAYSVGSPQAYLSERALERRERQGLKVDETDLPVCRTYIDAIIGKGASVVTKSKWNNTVVVEVVDTTLIEQIARLPFVTKTKKVWTSPDSIPARNPERRKEVTNKFSKTDNYYGQAYRQIAVHQGDSLHAAGFKGEGMQIAVIDAGFYNADEMKFFKKMHLLGIRDFVNPQSDIYAENYHGMKVLSCLAANQPDVLVGTAPEASYWLLRSEDDDTEQPVEEDYWAAALEFADSVGVDVVSSSLGYFSFDVEALNYHQDQLDGRTSLISRAAKMASSKGILLFSSAGNEGGGSWGKITFPADAPDILTVGAITDRKKKSNFSSVGFTADYRVKPDVVALGTGCCVIDPTGNIRYANGTSFATPILAGLGVCLWQAFPSLTNKDIISLLQRFGSKFEQPDAELGYGIPDVYKAYKQERKYAAESK